jgi:hypothetical protein
MNLVESPGSSITSVKQIQTDVLSSDHVLRETDTIPAATQVDRRRTPLSVNWLQIPASLPYKQMYHHAPCLDLNKAMMARDGSRFVIRGVSLCLFDSLRLFTVTV